MSFKEGFDFATCINKDLKGTKTEKNLEEAFCGESKARNKYKIFAQKAREEGYLHIANIFDETSENEAEHGKIWLKLLNGGRIPDTLSNLRTAAGTENYEWEDMYARFAKEAEEEGFNKIAFLFETIRSIEKMHMTRYNKMAKEIIDNTLYKKETPILWECDKCGYRFEGEAAPEACAFCKNPQKHFFPVESSL